MPNTDSSQRLDRIESKIDRLTDALVSLARTEEKILAMEDNYRNNFERMNRFSEKLDHIDRAVQENKATVDIINKIGLTVLVAVIGSIIKFFWL